MHGQKNIKLRFFLFSLQFLSEIFLILRRNERDIITNVYWSSCKVLVILVSLQWNLNFLKRFSKNTQVLNFMKIRSVGEKLLHADGPTDTTKVTEAFRNSVNAPKNSTP